LSIAEGENWLALAVFFVAAAISRRETGIMAVSALVIFGLALRAALTSPL